MGRTGFETVLPRAHYIENYHGPSSSARHSARRPWEGGRRMDGRSRRRRARAGPVYSTGSFRMKRVLRGPSWGSYGERNQKSATEVAWGRGVRRSLPSRNFGKLNSSSPSWSPDFRHFATPWAPRESLTGGHVKVMLAYGHSLSHGHQGFRPFSPDHGEAAGPVGPAVGRV